MWHDLATSAAANLRVTTPGSSQGGEICQIVDENGRRNVRDWTSSAKFVRTGEEPHKALHTLQGLHNHCEFGLTSATPGWRSRTLQGPLRQMREAAKWGGGQRLHKLKLGAVLNTRGCESEDAPKTFNPVPRFLPVFTPRMRNASNGICHVCILARNHCRLKWRRKFFRYVLCVHGPLVPGTLPWLQRP